MRPRTPRFSNCTRKQIGDMQRVKIDGTAKTIIARKKYNEESLAMKSTTEYQQYELRKKLVQTLDKANKNATSEQIVINTLNFFTETINLIAEEYNNLISAKKINDLDLINLAKAYSIHTKNIIKFDETTELNPSLGYDIPLFEKLETELNKLNENLFYYFSLDISVILSM